MAAWLPFFAFGYKSVRIDNGQISRIPRSYVIINSEHFGGLFGHFHNKVGQGQEAILYPF